MNFLRSLVLTGSEGSRNVHNLGDVLVKSRVEIEVGTYILAKKEKSCLLQLIFGSIKLKVLFAKVQIDNFFI